MQSTSAAQILKDPGNQGRFIYNLLGLFLFCSVFSLVRHKHLPYIQAKWEHSFQPPVNRECSVLPPGWLDPTRLWMEAVLQKPWWISLEQWQNPLIWQRANMVRSFLSRWSCLKTWWKCTKEEGSSAAPFQWVQRAGFPGFISMKIFWKKYHYWYIECVLPLHVWKSFVWRNLASASSPVQLQEPLNTITTARAATSLCVWNALNGHSCELTWGKSTLIYRADGCIRLLYFLEKSL